MERTRQGSRLRIVVFVLLALLGGSLLAFSPRPRQQETQALADRIRNRLPGVYVTTDGGLVRSDRIYIATSRSDPRYLARVRPASRRQVAVAFYDAPRSSFGDERIMSVDSLVSHLSAGRRHS